MPSGPTNALLGTSIAARGYDVLNQLLWFPAGSDRLRQRLTDALDLRPGMAVLELGCGTGLVTRHLVASGAEVTAVDGSDAMLTRARRRAPCATFALAGVDHDRAFPDVYDRIVLSFLLHELDPEARELVLRRSVAHLTPRGRVGILEWGLPASPRRARLWRSIVGVIEPPVAHDVLDRGLDDAIAASGGVPVTDTPQASGRARIVVLHDPRAEIQIPPPPPTTQGSPLGPAGPALRARGPARRCRGR